VYEKQCLFIGLLYYYAVLLRHGGKVEVRRARILTYLSKYDSFLHTAEDKVSLLYQVPDEKGLGVKSFPHGRANEVRMP
jgi:hypothetical protein